MRNKIRFLKPVTQQQVPFELQYRALFILRNVGPVHGQNLSFLLNVVNIGRIFSITS